MDRPVFTEIRKLRTFVAIAEEVHRELDDHALVVRHELREGQLVPLRASSDERSFAAIEFRPADRGGLLHGIHATELRPPRAAKVPCRIDGRQLLR